MKVLVLDGWHGTLKTLIASLSKLAEFDWEPDVEVQARPFGADKAEGDRGVT